MEDVSLATCQRFSCTLSCDCFYDSIPHFQRETCSPSGWNGAYETKYSILGNWNRENADRYSSCYNSGSCILRILGPTHLHWNRTSTWSKDFGQSSSCFSQEEQTLWR